MLESVTNICDGTCTAVFGYNHSGSKSMKIPVGAYNRVDVTARLVLFLARTVWFHPRHMCGARAFDYNLNPSRRPSETKRGCNKMGCCAMSGSQ